MDTPDAGALSPLGDIPLLLARPQRAVEHSAQGIAVGVVRLRAWQVDAIPRRPPGLAGHAAYLIKIAYDLDLEPGVPGPLWFEVGFAFAVAGVIVHDTLPQQVYRQDEARTYALNSQLAFVRQDQPAAGQVLADIVLPAVTPEVEVLGRGSPRVRWRHTGTASAPIRPGSRTGWIVLLAPPGQRQVPVSATAGFSLPGETDGLRTVDRPEAFTIDLTGPGEEPAQSRVMAGLGRVFVSYAHESAGHKTAVRALSDLLRASGVRVTLDQTELSARQDWQEWMTRAILRSDFVIVIASPAYRQAGRFAHGDDAHAGVQDEYRLLRTLLADDRDTWLRKILPVVLPGRAVSEIPLALQPYHADHYLVPSLTAGGIAGLLQALGGSSR